MVHPFPVVPRMSEADMEALMNSDRQYEDEVVKVLNSAAEINPETNRPYADDEEILDRTQFFTAMAQKRVLSSGKV